MTREEMVKKYLETLDIGIGMVGGGLVEEGLVEIGNALTFYQTNLETAGASVTLDPTKPGEPVSPETPR